MILIQNYSMAILFFVLAMICWGSWANTQKLAEKNWRFELFYWDLIIGIFLMSIIAAFTVGSLGTTGRTFMEDIVQSDLSSICYAALGGVLWNTGNLLLVAAIAVAGMSVAFPIGGGIAWILGIIINYIFVVTKEGFYEGNQPFLWSGVIVIVIAIYLSGKAFKNLSEKQQKPSAKGILLSVTAGIFIAFFYGFVVKSIDNVYLEGGNGKLSPFTAIVFFSAGVIVSTFILNPIFMRRPVEGPPVKISEYFKGRFGNHLTGILGGLIWCLGTVLSYMAAGAANPAISYAISNAAPVVAILWGVFVWKEFKGASKNTNSILAIMFVLYLIGLGLITYSNI